MNYLFKKQTLQKLIWGWMHTNRLSQVCHTVFLTPALQLTQREQNMWWVNINLSNRFTTFPRCPREASDHLGNHSLAAYRLSRFTDSTEACEAERLQAGLRVHIKMTSRGRRGTRSRWWRWMHIHVVLPESGSWNSGGSLERLGANMVAVVRSEARL